MTGVFIRGKYGHRDTQGECHVTIDVEIGVMCLQAKEYQGLPHKQLEEARKDPIPEPSGRAQLSTP